MDKKIIIFISSTCAFIFFLILTIWFFPFTFEEQDDIIKLTGFMWISLFCSFFIFFLWVVINNIPDVKIPSKKDYFNFSRLQRIDIFLEKHQKTSISILFVLIIFSHIALAFLFTRMIKFYIFPDEYYANAIAGGFWGAIISWVLFCSTKFQKRKEPYKARSYVPVCILLLLIIIVSFSFLKVVGL